MTGRNITIRESDLLTLLVKLKATGLDHVHDIETQKIESTFVTSAFLGGVDFPARAGYSQLLGIRDTYNLFEERAKYYYLLMSEYKDNPPRLIIYENLPVF